MQPNQGRQRRLLQIPLFRLLAINLALGFGMAVVLVGGLLAFDPFGLRHLVFSDRSPGIAIGLLLGSFFVTFGSTAMGTAIMALGRSDDDDTPHGGTRVPARVKLRRS